MIHENIKINENAFLETWVMETESHCSFKDESLFRPEKRPAVLLIPGGGYSYVSERENEPVVYHYMTHGYACFTLHYSCGDDSEYPGPLLEGLKALRILYENSDKYHIDESAVFLCGFSAGGHLAGLLATQYHYDKWLEMLPELSEGFIKPAGVILGYPITDMKPLMESDWKHIEVWARMLTTHIEETSVVDSVTVNMPPAFIWHTRTDGIVPVSQSLALVNRMVEKDIPVEFHMFYEGFHGLSTNDVLSNYKGAIQDGYVPFNVSKWVELSVEWINHLSRFN